MKSLTYSGFGIHLKVADITVSRQFYEGTLDLVPVFGYGDDEFRKSLPSSIPSVTNDGLPGATERYRGVTYEPTPQSPIEIADGHIAVTDQDVFRTRIDSPKISAMLRVASLQPLIVEKKLRPHFPVRHYYWGSIEAVVRDPDGFVVVLITPYSAAEADALSRHVTIEAVTL